MLRCQCPSVCPFVVTVHAGKRGGVISSYASHCWALLLAGTRSIAALQLTASWPNCMTVYSVQYKGSGGQSAQINCLSHTPAGIRITMTTADIKIT